MKPICALHFLTILVAVASSRGSERNARLLVEPAGSGVQLRLPQDLVPSVAGTQFRLNIEASADLKQWTPKGQLETGADGTALLALPGGVRHEFFRLHPELVDASTPSDGGDIFGYNRAFKVELRAAGTLSPEQFAAANQPSPDYLPAISFDPATAKSWERFNQDPVQFNASLPPNSTDKRLYDFRLNATELGLFKTNGFVVSERLGTATFADGFYRVFSEELPVFVSADAILHAWHLSYQRLLEESEETQLAPTLQQVLTAMHLQMKLLPERVLKGPLSDSVRDADYYLAVGRSLLTGELAPTFFGSDSAVTNTLAHIAALQLEIGFEMFGEPRPFDFSQFTVRGHYEKSQNLARYFRAFMWTARADLRVLTVKPSPQTLRELGTAIVLTCLLESSGEAERWRQMDDMIRLFVGRTDAMTFSQMQPLLESLGIQSPDAIYSADTLRNVQEKILQGNLGAQLIAGEAYFSPTGPEQYQLPNTFVLTGQRFNPDGWALGNVIYDRILWNGSKVIRRYTSGLDMAYSVLGNRAAGPEIAERMLNRDGLHFRDGLPYAHNLVALARTFERIPAVAWEESIYTRWLGALRELSAVNIPADARFPEAMRTRAWAMRLLNTQLASYTELKHDTVLYAKQPYTGMITCEYPAGFVEPIPYFWAKMREMAEAAATHLMQLPVAGFVTLTPSEEWLPSITVNLAERQAARVNFCHYFAQQMGQLEALARRELFQEPFLEGETAFIKNLMNRQDHPYYGPSFDGWYPNLYYTDYSQFSETADQNGSNKADPLITDVHTAPPDQVDLIGGVLHEATGNVDLLMIAVDNGPDRMVYAGPVLSQYEFIVPGPELKRVKDSEWQGRVAASSAWPLAEPLPARPDWTRSYLVPKW